MLNRVVNLVLATLAASRATWMVLSEDGPADILQYLRDFIYENYDESHWVYRGIQCPYCISFWMVFLFLLVPSFIREWFAMSEVARWLIEYDRKKGQ